MKGPRPMTPKIALAAAMLLLLPACSPRKSIPSDPPEARPEAEVRGARQHRPPHAPPAQQAAKPAQPQGPVVETVVAEVKDPQNTDAQIKTAVAKTEARQEDPLAEALADGAREEKAARAEAPRSAVQTDGADAKPQTSSAKAEATPVATGEAAPAKSAEQTQAKPEEAAAATKAEPAGETNSNAKQDATAAPDKPVAGHAEAGKAAETAQSEAKTYMVQIASFNAEKNADAALTWLKDMGYARTKKVRVEQGSAVYLRVQAGPFQDLATARKVLEELKTDWPQAFIPAD